VRWCSWRARKGEGGRKEEEVAMGGALFKPTRQGGDGLGDGTTQRKCGGEGGLTTGTRRPWERGVAGSGPAAMKSGGERHARSAQKAWEGSH
jgi:hypothetical protein